MENVNNRSSSDSRDPLTPDLQDPAPQKKKKKKKASNIGSKPLLLTKGGTSRLVGSQQVLGVNLVIWRLCMTNL